MLEHSHLLIKISHPDQYLRDKYAWFLSQPGIIWLEQPKDPLINTPQLRITRKGVFLDSGEDSFCFHPSMALLRLLNIQRGEPDRFLSATGLQPGDYFMDTTLGLGTDALIGAWAVGEEGKVLAVERAGIMAALVKDGLKELSIRNISSNVHTDKEHAWNTLAKAASRIQVQWGDHYEILRGMTAKSIDVIYFDPMFRHTREQSASIRPLHRWAESNGLNSTTLQEACRVAKKRIILKERKNSSEFARLGFKIFPGGKYSQVDYGIINLSSGGV